MFQIGDTILYGVYGVCAIVDIVKKNFNGEATDYYVLKPVEEKNSTAFVPVNGLTAEKFRCLLSADEIYSLIEAMPDEEMLYIENELVRREKFKEIIAEGDRTELIRLIKTLYLQGRAKRGEGKKLNVMDERLMKDAEKILYDEFAHVLNIEREQVLPFITEQIEAAKKQAESL
ncbi:MAG: CarD family transcriptional regulator [Oscillospiraceae bacterium]|jgi:CarD family transcriptional regulator|nr:CarD family transcriptional regulator [Oscillospiraceae bacterium]